MRLRGSFGLRGFEGERGSEADVSEVYKSECYLIPRLLVYFTVSFSFPFIIGTNQVTHNTCYDDVQ